LPCPKTNFENILFAVGQIIDPITHPISLPAGADLLAISVLFPVPIGGLAEA
jgi:hypothetical protein